MHRDVFGGEENARQMPPAALSPSLTSAASASIGVNLRVTGHCSQGGRKYMEDFFSVAYHESENNKDLEYAFIGIYDGHGGSEAATFAKEHLMMEIVNQKLFWSDSDQDVLRAIREGYIATHYAMWREQEKWPKTATGLPSTAGTTATVAFIRHEKIYIGHVGDSGIVLGYQNSDESFWRAKQLTLDHKPESSLEKTRIINSGGKVVAKSGVPRVVWNRPRSGHKGPVRRSTPIDEIPFLAVARSLGDLWSYNSALNEFIVSPDPDVKVIKINPDSFRCLIFGTDGLWNVVTHDEAVDTVRENEKINESVCKMRGEKYNWCNPSKSLVERALKTWSSKKMRADNTSVVTVILYPPDSPSPNSNCGNNLENSHGLEFMHMNVEVNPNDSQICAQKLHRNADCKFEHRLLDTDSLDQTHQLPHYETIDASSIIRQRLQQQFSNQNEYTKNGLSRDDITYGKSYQKNCDNNEYLYYDDQVSNNYINSFAESYNSLLRPNLEEEDNSCSNAGSGMGSSDESNESAPSEYHSYNSLHHTGLAGHDRVHHHYPNNEYQKEQQLYQEQCMSAEEGYSLTKLETRVEQQLRGNNNRQMDSLASVKSFQIFGGGTGEPAQENYHQYNTISSNFQKGYNDSDNSNSNFLSSYEDNARSYEPNSDVSRCIEPPHMLPENVIRTTSLFIERLDAIELERFCSDSIEQTINPTEVIELELETVLNDKIYNPNLDETIQIHEVSSSVVKAPFYPLDSCAKVIPKTLNEQSPTISHENTVDLTPPLIKSPVSKIVVYPNVPNENHRTPRRLSIHQCPRNIEKRMLRSMTVDYSKRTLRSRNTLSKDLKSKSPPSKSLRKSINMQNKCLKTIKPSSNAENSSVVSKKCLTLRSREITTTSGICLESNIMPISSSSASQKHQRKSKLRSFCDSSDLKNESLTTRTRNDGSSSSSALHRKSVGMCETLSSSSHRLQQVSISFAKRSSLRNSGWGSGKTTMQTRNRIQKRMSR